MWTLRRVYIKAKAISLPTCCIVSNLYTTATSINEPLTLIFFELILKRCYFRFSANINESLVSALTVNKIVR